MAVTRRKALTIFGSALFAPAVLRPRPAMADTITLLGPPKLVDSSQPGPTFNPVAAALPSGGFVITFTGGTGAAAHPFARWFSATGTPLGPSVPFGIDGGFAAGPVVFPDGRAVLVYSANDGTGNGIDVFGQQATSTGTLFELPVSLTDQPGDQIGGPPVLRNSNSFFEVLLESNLGEFKAKGSGFFVDLERIFDLKNLTVGPANFHEPVDLIRTDTGALLTYMNYNSFFSGDTFYRAQRFDRRLNRVGSPITLDRDGPGRQLRTPRAVLNDDGTLSIVWPDQTASGAPILRGRRFSATGTPLNGGVIPDRGNLLVPELIAAPIGDTNKMLLLQNKKQNVDGNDRISILIREVDEHFSTVAGPVRISAFHTSPQTSPRSLIPLSGVAAGNIPFLATYNGGEGIDAKAYLKAMRVFSP